MNYKSITKTPGILLSHWMMPGLKYRDEIIIRNPAPELKEMISKSILNHYGLSREMVFEGNCRKREVVVARQLIMTFYKKYTKMSLKSIGQEFCGDRPGKVKDHTTVIHSIRTIKNLCDTDRTFQKEVQYIECMFL